MYITKIILDGFKSYATRTEIVDFDRSFNAITGLNGSGKSNILDSICFVLGITNLSHVRANSLQELIYKNGQAGIEKATVSIVFDNSDKTQSPVGYEGSREVTITRQVYKQQGKNRYLINGTVVPANKVKDLFGSVSLNVNNPHFLIMQGRVTKVLNMKPPEILAMLEEATGTRMYEDKKRETQRTIEKKDAKLLQIDTVLKEDLEPQMNKLAEERQAFVHYNTICRQLEQLQKVHTAYQFLRHDESSKSLAQDVEKLLKDVEENLEKIEQLKNEIKDAKQDVRALEAKQDEQSGDKLSTLERTLKDRVMAQTKADSDLKHLKEQIRSEEKSLKEGEKSAKEAEVQIVEKQKVIEKINSSVGGVLEHKMQAEKDLEVANRNLESLALGLTTNEEGVAATLTVQLSQAVDSLAEFSDEAQKYQGIIEHANAELQEKKRAFSKLNNPNRKDESEVLRMEQTVKKIQARLASINYDEGRTNELTQKRHETRHNLNKIKHAIDGLEAATGSELEYQDPHPGFDRRRVIGKVSSLFDLKDSRWVHALEAAASGKLGNVVVDTNETAKELLKRGNLRSRVTFVPLNKIRGSDVDDHTLRNAQKLVGPENIFRVLDLIEYDRKNEEAMKYIFGRTLIAATLDIAEKVAYHPSVKTKTVSVCGSVCDPSGVLSGGSNRSGASLLENVQKLKRCIEERRCLEEQLQMVESELDGAEKNRREFSNLSKELGERSQEYERCKAELENTEHTRLKSDIERLEGDVASAKVNLKECAQNKIKAETRIREIKDSMKNEKGQKEKRIKEAKAKIEALTKQAQSAAQNCSQEETKLKELQGDIELLRREIEEAEQKRNACKDVLQELSKQISTQEAKSAELRAQRDEAETLLEEHKKLMRAQSGEIASRYKTIDKKQKEIDNILITNKQAEHDVKEKKKEASDAAASVKAMIAEYPWIKKDRDQFGKPNTDYDFGRNDPRELGRKVKELAAQKEKLSKTVNARAHTQASHLESQYKDLIKKRQQVVKDKENIMNVMRELDIKKEQTIREAFNRVNKDFGDIFSSLLNGASAKLQPPPGKTLLDGLEIKVSFGGVWKESLTELSGGQRSLVALSLILALLLFKPAPIYILDEVDAALDLAHTQNIGLMIKNHFRTSQFIIVSLKDGLFSNANVLFRTKFVDGKSTVERFASKKI